ncbi:MAG: glycosyltransferase 87 family protein [Chloroflexi bacterium]|nr:glycosyltransferase 87 family protein [Chloroflexota bacterium]
MIRLPAFTLLVTLALLSFFGSLPFGDGRRDFGSFIASGRAFALGLDPYARDIDPTLTPPFTLPILGLLANSDPKTALWAWYSVSLALYVVVFVVLLRAYPRREEPLFVAWTLAFQGIWCTLLGGQIYVLLVAITTCAWLLLRSGRYLLAG